MRLVVMTGYLDEEVELAGRRDVPMLSKPFRSAQLVAAVADALARPLTSGT